MIRQAYPRNSLRGGFRSDLRWAGEIGLLFLPEAGINHAGMFTPRGHQTGLSYFLTSVFALASFLVCRSDSDRQIIRGK